MGLLDWLLRRGNEDDDDDGPAAFVPSPGQIVGAGASLPSDDAFALIAPHAARDPIVIENQIDLAAMDPGFTKVIVDIDVGGVLTNICPVELTDGTAAIFVVQEHVHSDQANAVLAELARAGKAVAARPLIVVPPHVVTWIQRGNLTAEALKTRASSLAKDSPLFQAFQDILNWADRHDASDITLNLAGPWEAAEVCFTIGGKLVRPERFFNMKSKLLADVLGVIYQDLQGSNGSGFDQKSEQQGRLLAEARGRPRMLRFASLAADAGASVCMRVLNLDQQLPETGIAGLGYLPSQLAMLERAATSEGGAVVFSGVVNSGKSTTIAAYLSSLPPHRKVITLEDPVEYLIPRAIHNTVSRKLRGTGGTEGNVFSDKLMQVKRSAMTDLLIGEIRDEESGVAWMDVTGSGTNTYTTTHAPRHYLTIDRLASDKIKVSRDFLGTPGMIKLITYQALLPAVCENCALPLSSLFAGGPDAGGRHRDGDYWRRYSERIGSLYEFDPECLKIRNVLGCEKCRISNLHELFGFAGRTVVAEMLEPALDDEFLRLATGGDKIRLRAYVESLRVAPFNDPNMDGKSAMECAIYKAYKGQIDPREIEIKFTSFETVELRSKPKKPVLHAISGTAASPTIAERA